MIKKTERNRQSSYYMDGEKKLSLATQQKFDDNYAPLVH